MQPLNLSFHADQFYLLKILTNVHHIFPSCNMQSASKLLDTGLNTVQSTLLLKKQVEVEKVQEDLDIKRRQFAERMAACKAKEEELKKKQTQVKYQICA